MRGRATSGTLLWPARPGEAGARHGWPRHPARKACRRAGLPSGRLDSGKTWQLQPLAAPAHVGCPHRRGTPPPIACGPSPNPRWWPAATRGATPPPPRFPKHSHLPPSPGTPPARLGHSAAAGAPPSPAVLTAAAGRHRRRACRPPQFCRLPSLPPGAAPTPQASSQARSRQPPVLNPHSRCSPTAPGRATRTAWAQP